MTYLMIAYTGVGQAQSPNMTRAHVGPLTLWTRCRLVIAEEAEWIHAGRYWFWLQV